MVQLNFDVWRSGIIEGEFGDLAGTLANCIYYEGVFINSAMSNSDEHARVIEQNEIIIMEQCAYPTSLNFALVLKDGLRKTRVLREDASVEEIDAFAIKNGCVHFS
jgi:hypothetical protein